VYDLVARLPEEVRTRAAIHYVHDPEGPLNV
jgi:hypothetical protein